MAFSEKEERFRQWYREGLDLARERGWLEGRVALLDELGRGPARVFLVEHVQDVKQRLNAFEAKARAWAERMEV